MDGPLSTGRLEFLDGNNEIAAELVVYSPAKPPNSLLILTETDAIAAGEAKVQLVEGARYEYEFVGEGAENFRLGEAVGRGIVQQSSNPKRGHAGVIVTGLNTGTLVLLARDQAGKKIGSSLVEVRSRKFDYRNDYRQMLEDITQHSVGLLMELRSSAQLRAIPDPGSTPQTINQRFAFIRALIGSRQFQDALYRVTSQPHHSWKSEERLWDVRRGFRANAQSVRQLVSSERRTRLSDEHPLSTKIATLPDRIFQQHSVQTEDTQENRFLKFALESFVAFLIQMQRKLDSLGGNANTQLSVEISELVRPITITLASGFFRKVSRLEILPLGSPVLQRKSGYREIFQAWLRFEMAARLVWQCGDDVYGVGQRDIATLYEYWVFFKLLEIVSATFHLDIPPVNELIENTSDGFGLKLKRGTALNFIGVTSGGSRPLRIRFSYNRSFSKEASPLQQGSWSVLMRPDYTLSLWPAEFAEAEAESQEIMTHLHFDAKYRVDSPEQLFELSDETNDIDDVSSLAPDLLDDLDAVRHKRDDLLKMHSYRDAIRRTQGAYVIYPGNSVSCWQARYEILPGLGAFPLKPGCSDNALLFFLKDIVKSLCDRAATRERVSYHQYQAYENLPRNKVLCKYPEFVGSSRHRAAPPVELFVVIGWYRSQAHLDWVRATKLFNFDLTAQAASFRLGHSVASASFLLLFSESEDASQTLMKVATDGPRVLSRDALLALGYPLDLSEPYQLVYDFEVSSGFEKLTWHVSDLPIKIRPENGCLPQAIPLDELLAPRLED